MVATDGTAYSPGEYLGGHVDQHGPAVVAECDMTEKAPREDKSPSQTDEQSGDEERTLACPNCDAAGIRALTVTDKNYACRRCGHHFDEPNERPVRGAGSTTPTAEGPQALMDADPEIVTDGGEDTPAFLAPRTEVVTCYGCGEMFSASEAVGIDVSPDDEYYPDMKPLCPACDGGEER